jgi:ATPase subunit of ABC transporter with duplicated ATPase domains
MTLIQLRSVDKFYGGRAVLRGLEMKVNPGARLGLVGGNGAGKSTMLRILAGLEEVDGGEEIRRRGLGVAYLPHLDAARRERLEALIRGFGGAVVIVSHDRYFLDRISDKTVEVRDGELYRYEGGYSAWRESKEARQGPISATATG